MKCQNCGKSEVNFHFSSNINGCVTEQQLCSECASALGYDVGKLFEFGGLYNGFFPIFGGQNAFLKMMIPGDFRIPVMFAPAQIEAAPNAHYRCNCTECASEGRETEVDDEMKAKREMIMQMREAAENEDFEKAAELRDKLKEMDGC